MSLKISDVSVGFDRRRYVFFFKSPRKMPKNHQIYGRTWRAEVASQDSLQYTCTLQSAHIAATNSRIFFFKKNWYSSDPVFLRIYDFIQVSTRIELNLLRRNSSVCMSWETFVCDRFETIKCWSWRECQHSTRSRCRHMRLTINIVCWWNTALFYIA